MQTTIKDILLNLELAALTLAATYAMYYIRKGIAKVKADAEKINNEDKRSLVLTAITRLDDVATKTVRAIEQTTASELRAAVKDGKASREELLELSRHAFTQIVDTLEPEYLTALSSTLGDVDAYIKNTIETKVLELKLKGAV